MKLEAENARLRATLEQTVAELDAEHFSDPELKGQGGCYVCWPKDGSWPCTTRMVTDEIRAVMAELRGQA